MALGSVAAGIVLFSSAGAFAQTSGTISGHVSDPSDASMPATEVVLRNTATGAERKTVTTGAGDYTFTEVPIGTYIVSGTHAGFKTSSTSALDVQIGQSVRVDLHLAIGATTETIEVSTASALLNTDNAATGTVIQNEEIEQLPLNGRNYLGLVALSSNVNTQSPASGQAGSRLGGDRASQSIAVGGQRIMFNYFTLDGVNNTDPDFNTYIGLPSPDAIQEMKVQTGVYSAEFGHEASQVNVVTKSGTNKYHGTVFEFIRNNYVDAQPYWFPTRHPAGAVQSITPFKYNDFGYELAGPVRIPKLYNGKDKFFFMISEEWYRSRSSTNNATAVVPTAALAAGNFQGFNYQYVDPATGLHTVPVTIYDPSTGNANGTGRQPFANNTIPTARIAPQTTALLKYLGTAPSLPTYSCPAQSSITVATNCSAVPNYQYSTTSPSNRSSFYARGDYNLSDRTQISFRYGMGNGDSLSTGLLGAGSKTITQYQQYMGALTHTFSPTVVNETRFGYSNFFNSLGLVSAYTTDVVSSLSIPGLSGGDPSTWGIPSVSFSSWTVSGKGVGTTPSIWGSGGGFGDQGGDGPYVVSDPSWQIVDNVTLIRGKHSLRLGFEYNQQTFNQLGNQFSRGQFFSQPLTTSFYTGSTLNGGDSLADLLLGNLQQSVVAVAVAKANDVRNVEAAYVDDTFKVSPKFTASIGLRYELTPPWTDTYGNNFNVRLPVMAKYGDTNTTYSASQFPYYVRQGNCDPSNVYQGIAVRWTASNAVCSNGQIPNDALMNTSYKDIAPRLGLSYSPTDKMVIRAGYGIFYTQDVANAVFDISRNIAGRVTVTNQDSSQIGALSNLTWANAAPGGSGNSIVNLPATTVAYANAVSHKTSYTEQFLLNIQQQLGKSWSVEAGYQGALSKHLYGFINANAATPYGYFGTTATTPASRQPFPNVAGGLQYVHDQGSANYNSATFKVNRRFNRGISLTSSYTYAKSLDNTSGIRSQGNDQLYPQNSYCLSCEYGPSAFDVRNRIVVAGLYELPIGKGKLISLQNKALISILAGWQVGGIFTHQTGGVATPQDGADNAGISSPFGNFDRPNLTGVSPYNNGNARSLDHWANPAAYVKSAPGTFGNASRGSFTGPGLTNLDASLHKDFLLPYKEGHLLSIRFEAFNVLNHPNFTTPNITINSSSFGQVGAGNMRVLQLAGKYNF